MAMHQDFPRWRLWHRAGRHVTDSVIGRLSSTLVIGVVGSVVGALIAHEITRRSSPWWLPVLGAILGFVGANLIAALLVLGCRLAIYPLGGYEDRMWEATIEAGPHSLAFCLMWQGPGPVSTSHFDQMELVFRTPGGKFVTVSHQLLQPRQQGVFYMYGKQGEGTLPAPHGVYDYRWYASTRPPLADKVGKLYELARGSGAV